jgi:hypothetical protein
MTSDRDIHKKLIERCLTGDIKAQCQLFRIHVKAMYNIAMRMMNNRMDADEIVQDSFVLAFRKLHTFRGELHMPETGKLELNTKYAVVNLGDLEELELNSLDDKIYGENVHGKVQLTAKYSDIEFSNLGPARMNIYDCKLEAVRSGDLVVESKYSDLTLDVVDQLRINGHDDNYQFQETGDIRLQTKYATLETETAGNLSLEIHDSKVTTKNMKNLTVTETKYSDIIANQAGKITVLYSHDDQFEFGEIESINVAESKYSEYKIDRLLVNLDIRGYNDVIRVDKTTSTFQSLTYDGKYGDINVSIPEQMPLKIDMKTKYGKLDYDESAFDTRIKIIDNSSLEYLGFRGPETENMPFLRIRGYDLSVHVD